MTARGAPERSLSFTDLARLALPGPALKSGITPGICEEDFFATDKRPFPYGVHIAAVEVDTETGHIKILDYLVTEDVGRKINPMIIEGQMAGGLAQGIGGAMLEEFVYSEDGQPLATSFMDYLLPTAMEMPKAQFISTEEFPSPHNPLGVKGAGEGGITAAGAALANAVSNALGSRSDAAALETGLCFGVGEKEQRGEVAISRILPWRILKSSMSMPIFIRTVASPKCSRAGRISSWWTARAVRRWSIAAVT